MASYHWEYTLFSDMKPDGCGVNDLWFQDQKSHVEWTYVSIDERSWSCQRSQRWNHHSTANIKSLPSGKLTVSYWTWPFLVSFPIKNGLNMVVFHSLSIKNGGSFHSKMLVITRGYPFSSHLSSLPPRPLRSVNVLGPSNGPLSRSKWTPWRRRYVSETRCAMWMGLGWLGWLGPPKFLVFFLVDTRTSLDFWLFFLKLKPDLWNWTKIQSIQYISETCERKVTLLVVRNGVNHVFNFEDWWDTPWRASQALTEWRDLLARNLDELGQLRGSGRGFAGSICKLDFRLLWLPSGKLT